MRPRHPRCVPAMVLALVAAVGAAACGDLPVAPAEQRASADPAARSAEVVLQDLHNGNDCGEGELPVSGGCIPYHVSIPEVWTGGLLVFAPGFVHVFLEPQASGVINGFDVEALALGQGFAFATAAFGRGLLEPFWIDEVLPALVAAAAAELHAGALIPAPDPQFIFPRIMTGGSQGGHVTALTLERQTLAGLFHGGLAACGPIGHFRGQVDHLGDIRVVFDHFFAALIQDWEVWAQGNPFNPRDPRFPGRVSEAFIAGWPAVWPARIAAALQGDPLRTLQLLQVTSLMAVTGLDPQRVGEAVIGTLQYSANANDAIAKLSGQPFQNVGRLYRGSLNDARLNARVERFFATGGALAAMAADYETSGQPTAPLVTIHTTGDPIVPYWHAELYAAKAQASGLHTHLPVEAFGHCAFTPADLVGALQVLLQAILAATV